MNPMDLVDADLLASTIRITTPVMLAALGGLISMRAGIFNIALEGQMIAGAFAAIAVTSMTGSTAAGVLAGVVAGALVSLVIAVSVLRFGANDIVASIAVNLLAAGLTGFLLKTMFDVEGTYRPDDMRPLPPVDVPLLSDVPIVGPVVSGQTPLVYVAFLLVAVTYVLLYRTPIGLAVRAVGEHPAAARTAGMSPVRVQTAAVVYSGLLCGLAGAHLALGYASEFTVGMTAGRGFTGFAAAIFGQLQPVWTMFASAVFGFAEAVGLRIQLSSIGLPSNVVQMFPYVLAIVAITIASAVKMRRYGRARRRELDD